MVNAKESVIENRLDVSERHLDYSVIKDDLISVLLATANKVEREWPTSYKRIDSAPELVLITLKLAINTFMTILYISADKPEDFRRDRRFCISLPPLSRTILEGILTILFVLEDLPKYSEWFFKSGYLEWAEALPRYERDYGDVAEWQPFIEKLREFVTNPPAFLNLTEEEKAQPKKFLRYWPNPGRMPRHLTHDSPNSASIEHMEYLNDWYYRQLSGQTHLSLHGFIERGLFFSSRDVLEKRFGQDAEEMIKHQLTIFRNDQVWTAIILMLALVSEIEMHFHFGLFERLKYLWTVIAEYSDYANDLYKRRYAHCERNMP